MSGISMSVSTTSKVWPERSAARPSCALGGDPHLVAGGLQHRRQHVAEERRSRRPAAPIARSTDGRISLRREPVGERHRQEVADVDHLGGLALDHGRAENAVAGAGDLDVQPLLDDVDDLVDHEPHRAAVVGEHQDRLRALRSGR